MWLSYILVTFLAFNRDTTIGITLIPISGIGTFLKIPVFKPQKGIYSLDLFVNNTE